MQKIFILMLGLSLLFTNTGCKEEYELSAKDKTQLDKILAYWETWVPAEKKKGTAPLMTFKDLYRDLEFEDQDFLNRIRNINPSSKDYDPSIYVKRIDNQPITRDGKPAVLDAQYLPNKVYAAYEEMMAAMKKDLGKRLWVESGYRSPAYQLYTFLYYTPKHHYSIKETRAWVALPGHSEHGDPDLQAIDFINEEGINGDSDFGQTAEDFEKLPEYAWLLEHAEEFGFILSYPRGHNSTTFEPWHWRYEGKPNS